MENCKCSGTVPPTKVWRKKMIESDAVEENPFGIPSGVSALRVSNQMGFFLLFFPEGNESPGFRFGG